MAKRAPQGEEPFRPLLDQSAISQVISSPVIAKSSPPIIRFDRYGEKVNLSHRENVLPSRNGTLLAEKPPDLSEKLDQEKRVLLSRRESEAVERLVRNFGQRLRTQLKLSHVLRAMLALFLNAENEIDQRAGEAGPLQRPPNGDGKGIQTFEREIACIIAASLRDAGPVRSQGPFKRACLEND